MTDSFEIFSQSTFKYRRIIFREILLKRGHLIGCQLMKYRPGILGRKVSRRFDKEHDFLITYRWSGENYDIRLNDFYIEDRNQIFKQILGTSTVLRPIDDLPEINKIYLFKNRHFIKIISTRSETCWFNCLVSGNSRSYSSILLDDLNQDPKEKFDSFDLEGIYLNHAAHELNPNILGSYDLQRLDLNDSVIEKIKSL